MGKEGHLTSCYLPGTLSLLPHLPSHHPRLQTIHRFSVRRPGDQQLTAGRGTWRDNTLSERWWWGGYCTYKYTYLYFEDLCTWIHDDFLVKSLHAGKELSVKLLLTFRDTFPGVGVQSVSCHTAAAPRQTVLGLRTLVAAAAVIHRAVSGRDNWTTEFHTFTFVSQEFC